MAAYAVMARIGRVDPHLTLRDAGVDESGPPSGLTIDDLEDVAVLEADRPPEPGTIVECLVRMRELWRQTTFYLFDAEIRRS